MNEMWKNERKQGETIKGEVGIKKKQQNKETSYHQGCGLARYPGRRAQVPRSKDAAAA